MSRDIALLHPELQEICEAFVTACARKGLVVGISQTWRTKDEQDELYAQGRTKPGSIVTNCRYPNSGHNWGVAFDIYRNDGKGAYNDSDGWFAKCGAVGKQLSLFWGGDFRSFVDKPHFEMPRYMPQNSCKALIAKYGTPEKFKETWEDEDMAKRYKTVAELPADLRAEAQKLVDAGALKGKGGTLGLDVTEDMIRSMIVMKRYMDSMK